MGNMSYCRMENTYRDLLDCLNDGNLRNTRIDELEDHTSMSNSEIAYAQEILNICKQLVDINE